jgi:hypothetical protein
LRRRSTHHDQQHQSSGILYIACGVLALVMAQQGVTTGVHMLLPAIGQAISAPPRSARVRACMLDACAERRAPPAFALAVITAHVQLSEHSRVMHQARAPACRCLEHMR